MHRPPENSLSCSIRESELEVTSSKPWLSVLKQCCVRLRVLEMTQVLLLTTPVHLVGRPWVYGAAVAGQEGVEQIIKIILADLDISLAQAGLKGVADVLGRGDQILTKIDF